MKLFLSDLHLGDGKERDDFQYHQQFDDLLRRLSEKCEKIEMILLGDIFDLIRTQKYYEFEGLPHNELLGIWAEQGHRYDVINNTLIQKE